MNIPISIKLGWPILSNNKAFYIFTFLFISFELFDFTKDFTKRIGKLLNKPISIAAQ